MEFKGDPNRNLNELNRNNKNDRFHNRLMQPHQQVRGISRAQSTVNLQLRLELEYFPVTSVEK